MDLSDTLEIISSRHGRTDWNVAGRVQGSSDDSRLTDKPHEGKPSGMEQPKLFGLYLQGMGGSSGGFRFDFQIIYSGEFRRVADGARIILSTLPDDRRSLVKIIYDFRLNERHLGRVQGTIPAEELVYPGTEEFVQWTGRFYHLDSTDRNRDAWVIGATDDVVAATSTEEMVRTSRSFYEEILNRPQSKVLIHSSGWRASYLYNAIAGEDPKVEGSFHSLGNGAYHRFLVNRDGKLLEEPLEVDTPGIASGSAVVGRFGSV